MSDFAQRVIAWQLAHGRHALPWQSRDPYAIWVSEIMLQQTQVATVIPYYTRFMSRFPEVRALAQAPLDDVLAHWSGLGYYSRARHLHAAARTICDRHHGVFPKGLEEVAALPGIGRSTAGAILAFAYGARHAILDGNVKRVLARCFGIRGDPVARVTNDSLWRHAEALLPESGIESYTQGLMDLGALVCTRRAPGCGRCPLSPDCVAFKENRIEELPAARARKALPHKSTVMLLLQDRGKILLEKRPPIGIWGGLWCFPEVAPDEDIAAVCAQRYGAQVDVLASLPAVEHGFTHFKLTITPQPLRVTTRESRAAEAGHAWWALTEVHQAGLPAPVRRMLENLQPPATRERAATPARRRKSEART